jgi:hypothetical protein
MAVGTALVAGLLVAGSAGAVVAAEGSPELGAVKAKPGRTPGEVVVRLPDGRLLVFFVTPPSGLGSPSQGSPGSGSPSGQPSGAPSGSPVTTPSGPPASGSPVSGTPIPVVSSLFPSPSASGSPSGHKASPSARPSRSAEHPSDPPAAVAPKRSSSPAQDGQGADAVAPVAQPQPQLPASTVPPPLGPQAVLRPDAMNAQIAAPATAPAGTGFAHRGRLLGVGLALIGVGAALFGWRIRRL